MKDLAKIGIKQRLYRSWLSLQQLIFYSLVAIEVLKKIPFTFTTLSSVEWRLFEFLCSLSLSLIDANQNFLYSASTLQKLKEKIRQW